MPPRGTKKRKRGRAQASKAAESLKPEKSPVWSDDKANSVPDPPESSRELVQEPKDVSMQTPSGQSSPVNSHRQVPQKTSEEVFGGTPKSSAQIETAASTEPAPKELTTAVVLQCSSCRTIFADTLEGYVGSNSETGTISFKAVRRITVADEDEICSTGWFRRCVFQKLFCEECGQVVGRKLNSTTTECDSLRGAYTFDKSCLLTYQLGSCAPVPQDPVRVNPEKAAADANIAVMQSMEEQISLVSEAVQSLAEGLEAKHMENSKFHDTFLLWEERFQRLETLETRLRQSLNNRMLPPVNGIGASPQGPLMHADNTTLPAEPLSVANAVEQSTEITMTEIHGSARRDEESGQANGLQYPAVRRGKSLSQAHELEPQLQAEHLVNKETESRMIKPAQNSEPGIEGEMQPTGPSKFLEHNGIRGNNRLPS